MSVVRRIEALVRSDSAAAVVYDAACSHGRLALTPAAFPFSTLSDAAMRTLTRAGGVGGNRIFDSTSAETPSAMRRPPPPTCKLSLRTLGRATLAEVRDAWGADRRPDPSATHVGNWAIMVRKGRSDKPKYLTVCGFFDCNRHRTRGLGPEKLVKHMNLCTFARSREPTDYAYLFTGTFVVDRSTPTRPRILVNTRSGTWAMAKYVLALTIGDLGRDVDAAVTRFAAPRVRAVVREALHNS